MADGLVKPSSNIRAADNGHGCLDTSVVVGRGVGSQGKCVNVGDLACLQDGVLANKCNSEDAGKHNKARSQMRRSTPSTGKPYTWGRPLG